MRRPWVFLLLAAILAFWAACEGPTDPDNDGSNTPPDSVTPPSEPLNTLNFTLYPTGLDSLRYGKELYVELLCEEYPPDEFEYSWSIENGEFIPHEITWTPSGEEDEFRKRLRMGVESLGSVGPYDVTVQVTVSRAGDTLTVEKKIVLCDNCFPHDQESVNAIYAPFDTLDAGIATRIFVSYYGTDIVEHSWNIWDGELTLDGEYTVLWTSPEVSGKYWVSVTLVQDNQFFTTPFVSCFTRSFPVYPKPHPPELLSPAEGDQIPFVEDCSLSWQYKDPQGDAVMYDLYLGKNGSMQLWADSLTYKIYVPRGLEKNSAYSWKIVAKDGKDADTESEVGSFTTGESRIDEIHEYLPIAVGNRWVYDVTTIDTDYDESKDTTYSEMSIQMTQVVDSVVNGQETLAIRMLAEGGDYNASPFSAYEWYFLMDGTLKCSIGDGRYRQVISFHKFPHPVGPIELDPTGYSTESEWIDDDDATVEVNGVTYTSCYIHRYSMSTGSHTVSSYSEKSIYSPGTGLILHTASNWSHSEYSSGRDTVIRLKSFIHE